MGIMEMDERDRIIENLVFHLANHISGVGWTGDDAAAVLEGVKHLGFDNLEPECQEATQKMADFFVWNDDGWKTGE